MALIIFILLFASAASNNIREQEPPNVTPQLTEYPSEPCSQTDNVQSSSQTRSSSSASSSTSSSSESFSSSQSSSSSYASSYSSNNGTKTRPLKCGINEYAVPCKTVCPPQNCDIAYTTYGPCPVSKCEPGCDCIKDHLRDNNKICVLNDNCPPPSSGEPEPSNVTPAPTENPPETSSETDDEKSSSQTESSSSASSSSSSSKTFSSSQSSSSSYASSYSSNNGTGGGRRKRACTYNKCTPTCSLQSPRNCPDNSNPCNCPPGTIISDKGGKCVKKEECQKYINCKGDYNASYTDCPIACPSTCAKPNAEFCNSNCENVGCACNYGYILNKKNGKCIKIEDCPGGGVCGKNETFVYCSVACPNNYCPTDDSRAIIACDPPYPCPSGCSCLGNYRRKSSEEFICILASNCPPVNCTRPNEVWNSCPEPCSSDNCSERNKVTKPEDCPFYARYCTPQCVCKEGFYRNATEICVKPEECPSSN